MIKNTFYFTLKALFILSFSLDFYRSCIKVIWLKNIWLIPKCLSLVNNLNRHTGLYLKKERQSMKFGQLIESNMTNIFPMHKILHKNGVEKLLPDPFLKN